MKKMEGKCTFREKKWPDDLEVEKNVLPLHSQTRNNGTPQATLSNLKQNGPFVYRLGREIFILKRGVRLS